VVGGACDFEALETTIAALKAQIKQTPDLKVCEKLQDRIVRLSSGVAIINVGGSTEVEMTERKHRIEDALEAVRSAQEQGVVPGGGTALLRAGRTLCITTDSTEQASVIKAACEEPIRQMATNAGLSADLIVNKVIQSSLNEGVDFRSGELINMLDAGIIDPVKVTLVALQNAASCAGTLITTNYGIIQLE
jgi:chaperonin GroEL